MASDSPSEVVYEGDVYHIDFNAERLDDLEAELQDVLDIDEGEQLYVSPSGDGALEVQVLKKRE